MADELHAILMHFRNTIQLDRDRLYLTKITEIEGIKIAHDRATYALKALITRSVIAELKDIAKNTRIDTRAGHIANRILELEQSLKHQ